MNILCIILVAVFSFLGIVMVSAGLPGTFAAWGGVFICALISGIDRFGWPLLLVLLGIAILGEVLEFISGMYGAKRYGSTGRGAMGAMIGGMCGAVILSMTLPGLGTLLGVMAGTFLGAFIGEYTGNRDVVRSGISGWGAFLGRVAAIAIKILLIIFIAVIAVVKFIFTG